MTSRKSVAPLVQAAVAALAADTIFTARSLIALDPSLTGLHENSVVSVLDRLEAAGRLDSIEKLGRQRQWRKRTRARAVHVAPNTIIDVGAVEAVARLLPNEVLLAELARRLGA